MGLSESQKKVYQDMLKQSKDDYESLDAEIQKEVEKVKKRVAQLKQEQKNALQIYAATCTRLSIKNDLKDDLAALEEAEE